MISPTLDSLLVTAAITFFLEVSLRNAAPNAPHKRRRPRPVLSAGLILGLAVMAAIGHGAYPEAGGAGRGELLWVIAGGLLLYAAGLRSDFEKPATKRHLGATLAGGFLLVPGGFQIPLLGLPLAGAWELGTLTSALFTVVWIFLMVSMIEICALVPLVAGAVALLLGAGVFLPLPVFETFPGLVLSGTLMGGILGRGFGTLLLARSHPTEKSEVLVLGFVAGAATLSTYLKSITLTSFILPLGLAVIVVALFLTQSFEHTLILRANSRE